MRQISKLDKILLALGFLIMIGIYVLAFVVYSEGGQCVINPIDYAISKNITIVNPNLYQVLP